VTAPPKRERCHAENPRTKRLCVLDKNHSKDHYDGSSFHWKDSDPTELRAREKSAKPAKAPPPKKHAPAKKPPTKPATDKWGQKLGEAGYCAAIFNGKHKSALGLSCTLASGHEGPHENTSIGVKEHVPPTKEEAKAALEEVLGPADKPSSARKVHAAVLEHEAALIIEADAPEAEEPDTDWAAVAEESIAEERALAKVDPGPQMLAVEQARDFLAKSRNLDEVKGVVDQAKAVALYLRSRNASIESQNDAVEIRLHAERRLGELSMDIEEDGRGHKKSKPKAATSAVISKGAKLAELGLKERDARRFEQLAKIPEEKFDELITETKEKGERLTSNAPLKMVRQENKAKAAAELRAKPIPQVDGRFDVIIIDCPWLYEKRAEDITQRGQIDYPGMTQDELKALPVPDRAEDNCILFAWTTNAFIEDALELGRHWGFGLKTMLTWAKDRMGNGDWLRGKTEHCLMFVKGSPIVTLTNQTTLLSAPVREHSRKPDEFYALVESLCPGTKLDMFAREAREGFVLWGNETNKFKGAA
jgi:N6-adenosine-specific RNA methylase IME4